MLTYERGGVWHDVSSRQLYGCVHRTARQLEDWGIRKGDRVALLAENRMEWPVTDFACLAIGAVDVPIYPTLTAEQAAFALKNSGARAIFLSTKQQLEKVLAIKAGMNLERIVVMDEIEDPAAVRMSTILGSQAPMERDSAFDTLLGAAVPDDLATIIYTSGTTGISKGVMLTHGNLASNLAESGRSLEWQVGDVSLSFLPLSHVTARHVDYLCFLRGVTLAYCPSFDELPKKLQETRPQLIVAVPRVYEKVRQEVERRGRSGFRHMILQWALKIGQRHREQILRGETPDSQEWKLANRLVYQSIFNWFGGKVKMFLSGGAPLGIDLAQWFADVGIRIFEGYGLTETSPVIAVNNPEAYELGSVGKPLTNVECRIAADGELLVRGPSIFKGYWQNPQETANTFEGDWFKTGDIGEIDSQGFLRITDRKKDLIKTSGGKFVAPQPIENKLKTFAVVGYSVVIGNLRKFVSVVICPNFPALQQWAREQAITFSSREELVAHSKVAGLYQDIVNQVNRDLAHFETLKKILIVPDEFTVEAGEVTPTLKLRRRVIEQKYRKQIDAMYAEGKASHPATV